MTHHDPAAPTVTVAGWTVTVDGRSVRACRGGGERCFVTSVALYPMGWRLDDVFLSDAPPQEVVDAGYALIERVTAAQPA